MDRIKIHQVTLDNMIENYHPLIQTEWEFYNSCCPMIFEGSYRECAAYAAQNTWKWRTSNHVFGGYWLDPKLGWAYMPV